MHREVARSIRDTVGDGLARSARRRPGRRAISFGERSWTYAELDAAANRVADALLGLGLEGGDRVAAYGRNSDAYVLLWLGCARAGLVHVPINYALTGEELLYILEQSGSATLFHDPDLGANVEAVRGRAGGRIVGTLHGGDGLDLLSAAQDASRKDAEPEVEVSGESVAQLLYTSGTTAAPKGAMMTHRALLAEYVSCIVTLGLDEGEHALAALPLYHSAQMHVFLMPLLLVGGSATIVAAPGPENLEVVEREGITSMFAPPTVWIGLLRSPAFAERDLSSLKKVYYGASIMPVPVIGELKERLSGAQLFNCYGQSEIAPLATVLLPEEGVDRPASVGRPVLNVETRIVDPEMNDAAPGELGEIVHRSPQLMVGYWNKPEETEEAFKGSWFHSGDLGYMDEEGYLFVVDRVKDVINTGGVLVAGREVEDALYGHPSVSEVAVIALPDPKWIEAVTAVVALKEGSEESGELADELVARAREALAPFKVPKHVFFVDDLPRNTAGKILKRELRAAFEGKVAPAADGGLEINAEEAR